VLYASVLMRDTLFKRFRIMAFRAPLLGYNTNVRHKGKLYHIQTEDSGIDHPHVITHLFADGGRIIASKKTSYAERVGNEGLADTVKKLMQTQHKAMFIALRDGTYDEEEPVSDGEQTGTHKVPGLKAVADKAAALLAEREAQTGSGEQPAQTSIGDQAESVEQPVAQPAVAASPERPAARNSLFGGDLLSDKTLDEVILNYLAANEKDS
jgi:hypothetical protein